MSHSSTDPEEPRDRPPRPLEDEIAASRPRRGGRINPATFEVRLRRWALLLLITVPAVWFVVQRLT
ncbi:MULTISPECIES: hypothetical protein [Kocuria]|uniref:Uncharacterized protein n=1 Tax=Kocuria turfanensis TaxID=388357 RepID=A0A512IFY5_9MICC|nr:MULTISPECIES: hypothetical protein [Kocuria]GEO96609.1 hypothetical protein KTU01_27320 [Kocuria turfanensis]